MNHHHQKEKLLFTWKLNVESITCKMCGIDGYEKEKFPPLFLFPSKPSYFLFLFKIHIWAHRMIESCSLLLLIELFFPVIDWIKRQNQISDGWINVSNFFWVRSDTCAYLIESILNLFMAFFFLSFFFFFTAAATVPTYFRFLSSDKE